MKKNLNDQLGQQSESLKSTESATQSSENETSPDPSQGGQVSDIDYPYDQKEEIDSSSTMEEPNLNVKDDEEVPGNVEGWQVQRRPQFRLEENSKRRFF